MKHVFVVLSFNSINSLTILITFTVASHDLFGTHTLLDKSVKVLQFPLN